MPARFFSAALAACLILPCQGTAAMPIAPVTMPVAPDLIELAQAGVAVRRGAAVGPRGGVVAGRGYVARGPRGNVVAGRTTTVVRPGYRRPAAGVVWVRPSSYWWHPGLAVASGAAIGFVTAAAATAYVSSRPPAPGYCWYYTDPQRTQGFWDVCPP